MLSESVVQQRARLLIAKQHGVSWRNNVGACIDQSGRAIRYGLCNDSKKLNEEIKSSDLIGVTPIFVTPEMVGSIVGVFTALECKPEGWSFPYPTNKAEFARCTAQARFHDIVRSAGGRAGFVTCDEDVLRIISPTLFI